MVLCVAAAVGLARLLSVVMGHAVVGVLLVWGSVLD